jgi:hypothetical protein
MQQQVLLAAWPKSLPRRFQPLARLRQQPREAPYQLADVLALRHARRLQDLTDSIRCSGTTGTWTECMFANRADYSAFAPNNTSEGSLLSGVNEQPVIPALFWDGTKAFGRTISIVARGVLTTISTPTLTFQLRLGTTAGSAYLSGASVGVSAAISTASGVTNKYWELRLDLTCDTPGQGSGNTTLSGAGYVMSPGGFASPFIYALEPTTPDTATWTATIDNSVTQYLNVSCTWGTANASNSITLKQLLVLGLN